MLQKLRVFLTLGVALFSGSLWAASELVPPSSCIVLLKQQQNYAVVDVGGVSHIQVQKGEVFEVIPLSSLFHDLSEIFHIATITMGDSVRVPSLELLGRIKNHQISFLFSNTKDEELLRWKSRNIIHVSQEAMALLVDLHFEKDKTIDFIYIGSMSDPSWKYKKQLTGAYNKLLATEKLYDSGEEVSDLSYRIAVWQGINHDSQESIFVELEKNWLPQIDYLVDRKRYKDLGKVLAIDVVQERLNKRLGEETELKKLEFIQQWFMSLGFYKPEVLLFPKEKDHLQQLRNLHENLEKAVAIALYYETKINAAYKTENLDLLIEHGLDVAFYNLENFLKNLNIKASQSQGKPL